MLDIPITADAIRERFMHAQPRPGQVEAIQFILAAFASGKDFVFLEGPTGSGKSVIGMTVSEFFDRTFYLTIQKFLQSQLSREFSHRDDEDKALVELKGRNAYPCTFYERYGHAMAERGALARTALEKALEKRPGCDTGFCHTIGKFRCRNCFPPRNSDGVITDPGWTQRQGVRFSTCPYYEQVERAIASRKALMNFSSFLYQTSYTTRFNARDLMIIDEAHHTEQQLMDFVSFTFSDRILIERGLELPEYDEPMEYAVWFHENNVEEIIADLTRQAHDHGNTKEEEDLVSLHHRLTRFMECISDGMDKWVCDYRRHNPPGFPPWRSILMRPVYVQHFAPDLLFSYAKKTLLMSATILDAGIMARSLNIPKEKMAFYRMPNNFPVEHRPIFMIPAYRATGGKDKQHEWGPDMVKWVDAIARKHDGQRGILHTHNFNITKMLLRDCACRRRFLYQENYRDKEELLEDHRRHKDSLIIAPAMHEGLDLFGSLSRFQIIVKTPYPNFFEDKQLAQRVEDDRRFLDWLVALKLVQAYGRSVRSADDWAYTYILDSTVTKFLHDAGRMIPSWFTEAIQRVKL